MPQPRIPVYLNPANIQYMPLEQATTPPGQGFWEVYADSWWAHQPGKGLLFYGKSPQCNRIEHIARSIQQRCWPDAELIHVPRVYVKHNCSDYL